MNERTWTRADLDKSSWGDGPWTAEPDKAQWVDDVTGLPCLAVRNPRAGMWCGYVGVPPDHQLHGVDYAHIDVSVHGGLTYANVCDPAETPDQGICHIPEPGQPDHIWWLGFDCHHAWDLAPGFEARSLEAGLPTLSGPLTYRTLDYVRAECAQLATQLAATPAPPPA